MEICLQVSAAAASSSILEPARPTGHCPVGAIMAVYQRSSHAVGLADNLLN